MKPFDQEPARRLLDSRSASGLRGLEVLIKESRSRVAVLEGDSAAFYGDGSEVGGAVRVVLEDGRSAMAFVSSPDEERLSSALARARELARWGRPDPCRHLPAAPLDRPAGATVNGPCPEREALLVYLESVRTAAARIDPGHLVLEAAWCRVGLTRTGLYNSAGFAGIHGCRVASLGVRLRAALGAHEERLVHEETTAGDPGVLISGLVDRAARRALGTVGARGGGAAPGGVIVLSPETAAPLLEATGRLFLPQTAVRSAAHTTIRRSWQPGDRVASAAVTILDDGLLPGGLSSAPFDGEGTPMQTTLVVDKGVLKNRLYDCREGCRAGMPSTGNSVRDSFREEPAPGITNLVLGPGRERSLDDLLGDADGGLLALSASPPEPHELDAGIYSVGLTGRRIRRSRLEEPVKGVRLRLPLSRALLHVTGVGGEARPAALDACVAAPHVRLEGFSSDSA